MTLYSAAKTTLIVGVVFLTMCFAGYSLHYSMAACGCDPCNCDTCECSTL